MKEKLRRILLWMLLLSLEEGICWGAKLSLKATDINSLHNTALAVARSNPRQDGLRFFVGYACDPNNPFNCLFSTCQPDGMCGCNANETTFLGMMCLPARRLGESCIDNQQCRKMSRNSKCDVPRSLTVGVCKCVDGTSGLNATCSRGITLSSVLDPDPKDTLEAARSKSCATNQQCLRFGKKAECNLFTQKCVCKPGYRMDEKDRQCKNINECRELPPQETCRGNSEKDVECVDNEGGFDCYCRTTKGRNNGRAPSGICCNDTQIPCDREPKCVDFGAVCDGFPDASSRGSLCQSAEGGRPERSGDPPIPLQRKEWALLGVVRANHTLALSTTYCGNGFDENFDYCIKPTPKPLKATANDTAILLPNRSMSLNSLDPVDPLPFTQM